MSGRKKIEYVFVGDEGHATGQNCHNCSGGNLTDGNAEVYRSGCLPECWQKKSVFQNLIFFFTESRLQGK